VHHTDCGLARLEEDAFREQLAKYAGYRPTWAVQAFKDPHDSVRESLRRVRESPFLMHTHEVRGFIFDVESGLLEEVFAD
jgi:carbonic anhydrase